MYFVDHPPPHFHAKYGEHQAQVLIATGEILHGSLPRRALQLVQEWTELHRAELLDDWERAEREEPLVSIEPRLRRTRSLPSSTSAGIAFG